MKKKMLTVAIAAIMVVACVFGIVACKDDSKGSSKFKEGTYVYWEDPETSRYSLEFKDGKASYPGQAAIGTYKVDGNKVTLVNINNADADNPEDTIVLEIVSDGVLKVPNGGGSHVHAYLVIEGKTPPSDDSEWLA